MTDARGRAGDLLLDGSRRLDPAPARISRAAALRIARRAAHVRSLRAPARAAAAILPAPGGARRVWRVLLPSAAPLASLEVLVDARSGAVLRTRDLLQRVNGSASVYDPNPVVANGGTSGLADAADADSALLTSLRVPRTLTRLDASTCLRGSFVEATLQPGDPDADTPAGDVCSPTRSFGAVTRSNGRFEALMAYFHIDRAQSYVQSLGFPNVLNSRIRANVDAPIPGPSTEDGQDNSYFDPLTGQLTFGTGWADDAEDGETIAHEYGHAHPGRADPRLSADGLGRRDRARAGGTTSRPRSRPPTRRGRGSRAASTSGTRLRPGSADCLRRVDWNLRPGRRPRIARTSRTSTARARSGPARSGRFARRSEAGPPTGWCCSRTSA